MNRIPAGVRYLCHVPHDIVFVGRLGSFRVRYPD